MSLVLCLLWILCPPLTALYPVNDNTRSDVPIRTKMEVFLHGVPIVVAFSLSTAHLVKKHFNDNGDGACINHVHYPTHCDGYEVGEIRDGFEIPCGRGVEGAWASILSSLILMLIPAVIITTSLGMIYSAVKSHDKKLSKYGVGALRTKLEQDSDQQQQPTGLWRRIKNSLTGSISSTTNSSGSRSNSMQSQSRAIMHKAFAYSYLPGYWLTELTSLDIQLLSLLPASFL